MISVFIDKLKFTFIFTAHKKTKQSTFLMIVFGNSRTSIRLRDKNYWD